MRVTRAWIIRFIVGLRRRRGPPSAQAFRATRRGGRSALRAFGPGVFGLASNAGADVRPLGFPRNDPRRPFGLAGLRPGANDKPQNKRPSSTSCFTSDSGSLRSRPSRASLDPTRTRLPALEACLKTGRRPKARMRVADHSADSQRRGRACRRLRPTKSRRLRQLNKSSLLRKLVFRRPGGSSEAHKTRSHPELGR